MKRTIAVCIAITLVTLFTGCSPERDPARQDERQISPVWTLHYSTKCAEKPLEECAGAHGFTVREDAKFVVGPTPQGQRVSGEIKAEEIEVLRSSVDQVLNRIGPELVATEECVESETQWQPTSLVLSRMGNELQLIRADGRNFCFSGVTAEDAKQLYAQILKLVAAYHPNPFPDECLEAAQVVHDMYPELQECRADSDCAFIDTVYGVIPQGEIQMVVTDDCTRVTPLAVGNAEAILSAQLNLIAARQKAREVCGEKLVRDDCTIQGFQAQFSVPKCSSGKCTFSSMTSP